MKKWIALALIGASAAAVVLPAQARNVKYMLSIPNALAQEEANLDGAVKLYFGPQSHGKGMVITTLDARSKSNIENRADIAACNTAFLDALRSLQRSAKDAGADAVGSIGSYFKRGPVVSSATEFECRAGSFKAHVMLKGQLVKTSGK